MSLDVPYNHNWVEEPVITWDTLTGGSAIFTMNNSGTIDGILTYWDAEKEEVIKELSFQLTVEEYNILDAYMPVDNFTPDQVKQKLEEMAVTLIDKRES